MPIQSSRLLDATGRPVDYRTSDDALVTPKIWSAPSNYLTLAGRATASFAHNEAVNFERTTQFSFFAWLYLNAGRTSGGTDRLIYNRLNWTTVKGISFATSSLNKPYVILSNTWETNCIFVRADNAVSTGAWHQWGLTYDGSSSAAGLVIYTDGAAVTTTTVHNNLSSSLKITSPGFFGLDTDSLFTTGSAYLDGSICEMQFYNKSLSASEVTALYASRSFVDPTSLASSGNLITYWRTGTDTLTFPLLQPWLYPVSFAGTNEPADFLCALGGQATYGVGTPVL